MRGQLKNRKRAVRPDAQAFDAISIQTEPVFKQSRFTGNEWKTRVTVCFARNNVQKYKAVYPTIEEAVQSLAYEWTKAKRSEARYVSEDDFCDQEGCSKQATVYFKIKQKFCSDGHATNPYEHDATPIVRQFCAEHQDRGNYQHDDCNNNYEPLNNNKKRKVENKDEK